MSCGARGVRLFTILGHFRNSSCVNNAICPSHNVVKVAYDLQSQMALLIFVSEMITMHILLAQRVSTDRNEAMFSLSN